jgi:hypothetical protein
MGIILGMDPVYEMSRQGHPSGMTVLTFVENRDDHGGLGCTNIERHHQPLLSCPFLLEYIVME